MSRKVRGGFESTWEACESTFADLVDRPKNEQESTLEQLRCADPELAHRVERLLAADSRANEEFLAPRRVASAAIRLVAESSNEEAADYSIAIGDRVGPFRVERPLGRGGMGEVFYARRIAEDDDEGFSQAVALKVIRPVYGRSRKELRQRFLRERRILARLIHPCIARLVDGGSTADGRPYLAMEFVAGESITSVCGRQRLDVARRLSLFLEACSAVQFAHENLVVHRDIKPSNVLVETAAGSSSSSGSSVKLLDFGIAGVLEGFEEESSLTRTGLSPATPDYASPEQLRGEPIGTTTDVFALGILLFELLAGERPLDWPPAGSQMVGLRPPSPLPAEALSISALPADLCSIVQRAIEEDPARRYGSVAALIADLERFQAGLPVLARQGNGWYRLRKFVSRNRWAATAGVALMAVFGVGLMGTLTQAGKAQRNAARAESVTEFLSDIFEGNDPTRSRGREVTAVELLDTGARRVSKDLAEEPVLRAEIETILGRLYRSLGSYQRSEELLVGAVSVLRSSTRGQPSLSTALSELAELRRLTGKLDEAKELLTEAMILDEQNLGLWGRGLWAQPGLSEKALETRSRMGVVRMALGEHEEGLALLRSVREYLQTIEAGPAEQAESSRRLGNALLDVGDLASAEVLFREAVASLEKILDPPDPRLARVWNDLGVTLLRLGRAEEALEPLRNALGSRRAVFGDLHVEVANSLRNLSGAERQVGNTESGLAMLSESLSIYRSLFGDHHPYVAETLNNLAVARTQSGDLEGAVEMFEQAVEAQRSVFGSDHPGLVLPLSSLGNLLTKLGRYPAAKENLLEARRLSLATLEEQHPYRALVAHNLAGYYLATGQLDQVGPLLEQALSGFEKSLGPDHPNVGVTLLSLGEFALAGDSSNQAAASIALARYRAASANLRKAPPQMAGRLRQALIGEAIALLRLQRPTEAVDPLLEVFAATGPDAGTLPRGVACQAVGLLRQAVDLRVPTEAPPVSDSRVVDVFTSWSDCQ